MVLVLSFLPTVILVSVGLKSLGCPDSETDGRYPGTLRMIIYLGALRPFPREKPMYLLSLSPSRIGNTLVVLLIKTAPYLK